MTLIKIYTKTTQQKQMGKTISFTTAVAVQQTGDRSSSNTKHYVCAFVSSGACNPSGNKQKISVRTDEPAGRESRSPRPDMLMPAGVPVTESCKCSSKTRWLVSHESAEGVGDDYEYRSAAQ